MGHPWRPGELAASGRGQWDRPSFRNRQLQNTKPARIRGRGLVLIAKGVADGSANTEDVVGVEVSVIVDVAVVLDVVVVNFGPDKHVLPEIVAETGAQLLHEVIGADVVRVTRGGSSRLVKPRVRSADAGGKVKASFLTQARLVEQVEIGQDRAVV